MKSKDPFSERLPEWEHPDDIWRSQLSDLDSEDRTRILYRANFISEYIKILINKDKENELDKAIRYDRIRQRYDIRKQSDNELAPYQAAQNRMIVELPRPEQDYYTKTLDELKKENKSYLQRQSEQPHQEQMKLAVQTIPPHTSHTISGKQIPKSYDWNSDPRNLKEEGHMPKNRCIMCANKFIDSSYAAFCNVCDKAMTIGGEDMLRHFSFARRDARIRIPEDIESENQYRRNLEEKTGSYPIYRVEFQKANEV